MIKIASPLPTEKPTASSAKKSLSRSLAAPASSSSASAPLDSSALLETGGQIKAKVIATAASGMLQVETSGGTLTAKSLVPLEVGKEFWFEVVKGGDNPLLAAAGKKNSVVEILRLLSVGLQAPAENITADASLVQNPALKIPAQTRQVINELLGAVVSQADPEPAKVVKLLALLGQRQEESTLLAKGQAEPTTNKKMSLLAGALDAVAVAVQNAEDDILPVKNIAVKQLIRALDILAAPRPLPVSTTGTETVLSPGVASNGKQAPLQNNEKPAIVAGDVFKAVVSVNSEKTYFVESRGQVLDVHSPVQLDIGKEIWFVASDAGAANSNQAQPVVEHNFIADLARVLRPLMNVAISPAAQAKLQTILFSPEVTGLQSEQGSKTLLELMATEKPEPEKIIKQLAHVGLLGFGDQGLAAGRPKNILQTNFNKLVELVAQLQQEDDGLLNNNQAGAGLKKTARLVEAHYQFNNHPVADRASENFLFPCFFADMTGGGEWMFSFERGDESGDAGRENYQLSFYLSMSNLGDIFLEMTKQDNKVKGVFSLGSDEALSHVRANLENLNSTLLGFYDHVSLSCRKSSTSAIGHLKEDLAAKSSKDSFLLVDVTA